ncbi:MAG TPA: hypothetical protein ENI95_03430 [Chloroflexi bacterium]|nr:hypothetical protein [Chloroflexota bacterium]
MAPTVYPDDLPRAIVSLRFATGQRIPRTRIEHPGDAAVTLADIEQALQTGTAEQIMGIVFNDETIQADFDQIEPLYQLFQRYGIRVRTVRDILENR